MPYSYIKGLHCPKCQKTYDASQANQTCACGSPLLVDYDLETLKKNLSPDDLIGRRNDLWRYHELLPVENEENIVSMGEGMTPLLSMPRLGAEIGLPHLYMKDEGIIPTGTFKARGAACGISKAKELGVTTIAMPSNGNAASAWSLYAARAGLEMTVVMPEDAPKITRNEVSISGNTLYLVDGLISDAGKIVGQAIHDFGWFDASTLKEPYRIEGKKTMGLEILEQMNWKIPDVILYPTGGGVGLIGIYKALKELQTLGWIGEELPRLVAVQAEGCAPIVEAWKQGKEDSVFWENSETAAFGINVPKALGDFLVLEAIYKTNGAAIAVSDEALLQEQKNVAQLEGAFICPEGAAAFVGARELRKQGWIKENETVVVLNTGSGIKYPDTVQVEPPLLKKTDKINPTLVNH
ncbi:MAG TPA: threonine synthase [Sporolactobacillaceae bacterium]|nr:threonine synthase [Sporolactobacillaceae bacterium]